MKDINTKKVNKTAEEQVKHIFCVNPFCPNCGEEHVYYNINLSGEEIAVMDAFYGKHKNKTDFYIELFQEYPLVVKRTFKCPICKSEFEKKVVVYRTDEVKDMR